MSSHYDKEILRSIDNKLDHVSETQIRMEADLKYHIKRTDLLEKQVKPMNLWFHAFKLVVPILAGLYAFKEQIIKFLGS